MTSNQNDGNGGFTLSLGLADESDITNFVLSSEGKFGQGFWDDRNEGSWDYQWVTARDECDVYGKCGSFASCDANNSPICSCLKGFEPKNSDEWNSRNWTNGCVRRTATLCERTQNDGQVPKEDGFSKLERVKVPDFAEWSSSITEQKCMNDCLNNCSCIAYAYYSGIYCMLWRGNLTDIKKFSSGGADLYIRLAYTELDNKEINLKLIISLTVVGGAIAIAISVFYSWRWIAEYRDEGNGTFTLSLGFANESLISNYILSSEGKFGKVLWDDSKGSWRYEWQFPKDECDFYGKCGPFGSCDARDSPICSCLKGFEPKNADEWNNGKWTSGCFRRRELQCERIQNGGQVGKEDGFLKLERMKVPDFSEWLSSKSEQTCKNECLNINCSCIAYSYYPGFGCMLWRGNLTDLKKFHIEAADLYIRLADSELDNKKTNMKVIISLTVVVGVIAVAICVFFSWRRIDRKRKSKKVFLSERKAWKLWNQGNIAALEFAKDRPAIFTVISMLKSEIVDLPTPKQPAFSERRGELDTESFQQDPRPESINNVTVTLLSGR
ncbi:hypothetical protein OIU85_022972 [Salix viminalis]|uniref:non-specific serine/threonine protein kinase n=1 Tax=Salix viminalis TaxID=40686 RepID=A0A9Q0Z8J1_SALVM|nr:hypothetical protein OIU85_022972 [Salix viminalis]